MQHIFNIRCENEMRVQLPLLLIYTTACFYLMLDKIIQALFHPLPPSTAACWLQTVPAGWWRHVCRERERGRDRERGKRKRKRERAFISSKIQWHHLSNSTPTTQSSLTSPPPRCQSRSVCRLNPSSFWHTSAAWTSRPCHSVRRSADRENCLECALKPCI